MRHIMLISGKDSLATAIVQIARDPSLPYELVFNEVGWELPDTLAWIDQVEQCFGRKITRCGDDLTDICYRENCLPLPFRRFCTKYAKIQALNDYLGKSPATIYFGLRADEPERVGYAAPSYQTPRYPLREAGLDLPAVWALCESKGLLPPLFPWKWLEDRILELLGADAWLLNQLPPWQRAMLVAWRVRNNCSLCFYKRRYEWVGLLEHYPEIFEFGEKLEKDLCHRQEHTWVSGMRLSEFRAKAMEIKERQARRVVKFLRSRLQRDLFDDDDPPDLLGITSCGLLCGK